MHGQLIGRVARAKRHGMGDHCDGPNPNQEPSPEARAPLPVYGADRVVSVSQSYSQSEADAIIDGGAAHIEL